MNQEIAKKLVLKGMKLNLKHTNLTDEAQLKFCTQAFTILKNFADQSSKEEKLNSLLEFFVKRIDKLFGGKSKEALVSEFLSLLGLSKLSSEIELYNYLFEQDIDVKAAKIFIKYFYEMENLNPNLYKSKLKLLKNTKLEVKSAIELGSNLLKDDKTMESFSVLIQSHFQNSKGNYQSITGEIVGKFLVEAYVVTSRTRDEDEG